MGFLVELGPDVIELAFGAFGMQRAPVLGKQIPVTVLVISTDRGGHLPCCGETLLGYHLCHVLESLLFEELPILWADIRSSQGDF